MTSSDSSAKLSEVAWLNPALDTRLLADADVAFVPMAAVSADVAAVEVVQTRPYAEVSKGYTPFKDGDVLLAKITPCFENGKIAQANLPLPYGFGSTEFHVVRPRDARADARYLLHYLRSPQVRADGTRRMTGSAGQRRVPESFLADLRVPAPSLAEQRRIAAILDQAETLRAQRRAAIAELDSLGQAVFVEMFGDEQTNRWPMSTVGDVADADRGSMRTGPFGSQLLHSEFVDQGIAVLGIDNAVANEFRWSGRRFISEAKYRALARYTVHPGDVLITIMGTCGRCAVVPDDIPVAINTKHLCCITLNQARCLPQFLHAYFLGHPSARKYLARTAKGAIMDGLNLGIIKAMPVPLAPISLQKAFADRIRVIDQLKATHRAALSQLDALFASLQHRAFRGELTRPRNFNALRKLEASLGLEALIFIAKRTPAQDLYKALKTVYFADRHHLEQQGRLLYGETHNAMPYGPVPEAAYESVKFLRHEIMFSPFGEEATQAGLQIEGDRLVALRDADLGKLSRAQIESLEWALRYCAEMSFGQVKAASHDTAYGRTPSNAAIPIEYLVDQLPASARQQHWGL